MILQTLAKTDIITIYIACLIKKDTVSLNSVLFIINFASQVSWATSVFCKPKQLQEVLRRFIATWTTLKFENHTKQFHFNTCMCLKKENHNGRWIDGSFLIQILRQTIQQRALEFLPCDVTFLRFYNFDVYHSASGLYLT